MSPLPRKLSAFTYASVITIRKQRNVTEVEKLVTIFPNKDFRLLHLSDSSLSRTLKEAKICLRELEIRGSTLITSYARGLRSS